MARRMYDLDNGTEDIKVKSVVTNNIVSTGNLSIINYSIDEEAVFIGLANFASLNFTAAGSLFNLPTYFSPYTTALRPTVVYEGAVIYDSTLKKCILWNGSAWVNLDGTVLS